MSVALLQLWLPIVVSAVLAWISSSLIHMLLKYHNGDYQKLSNEQEVSDALRAGSPGKGIHTMPHCVDMKEISDPGMQKRFADGPVAFVTVFDNGMPKIGKLVSQQILYFIFGSVLIAYCAKLALPVGASYLEVMRFVSVAGFLAYGWAVIPFSIWYGHPWSVSAKYLLDALIYGFVTAGVFGWLWPAGG